MTKFLNMQSFTLCKIAAHMKFNFFHKVSSYVLVTDNKTSAEAGNTLPLLL